MGRWRQQSDSVEGFHVATMALPVWCVPVYACDLLLQIVQIILENPSVPGPIRQARPGHTSLALPLVCVAMVGAQN